MSTKEDTQEELFSININWTSEGEYEPDWRIMSKDRFLYEWGLEQAEWDDMVNGGAIKEYPPARQEGETPINAPTGHSFSEINEFVHGDVHYEELQWAFLGAASHWERELSAKQAEVEQEQSNVRVLLFDQETLKTQLHNAKCELESLKAAQGWRPITPEAKEFDSVDLWAGGERIADANWSEKKGGWLYWNDGWVFVVGPITHYMLPPTPPVERSGE